MNKYIDADRLRAEIEKKITEREKELKSFSDEDYVCSVASDVACRKRGYLDIIELIDSLQQDQPEVDLEKEIEKEWKRCDPIDEGMGVETANIHIEAFDIIARHFFERGQKDMKEQMMKEAVEANVIATKCGDKYKQLLIADWNGFNDLLNADKVRIVVLKKEESK